ncbi:MAG TPA: hypothetical protein VG518_04940 [Solirubrobacterales bacterium]|nr:hypothetical protein [Solirubrobacterales bacterium]
MTRLAKPIAIYRQIARTYLSSAPSLLFLATLVFVPVGLLDAIPLHANVDSLNVDSSLEVAAVLGALALLTMTGLIGEVFYSGVVAVSLTHAEHGHSPSLRTIAGALAYRRLIVVDLLFGFAVAVGFALLVAPGVAIFVWFGLAGPIVEIEGRGVSEALRRSLSLVRGSFWTVFWVLVPIEVAGDALSGLATTQVHHLLGDSLLAGWAAESVSNILLTPIYAVAAVLLTLELILVKDGAPPPPRFAPATQQ